MTGSDCAASVECSRQVPVDGQLERARIDLDVWGRRPRPRAVDKPVDALLPRDDLLHECLEGSEIGCVEGA